MKMTRLQQRRNSSCNCGKTTKESKPFVTKNKTYETRSGVQRKQDVSNGFQKNLPVNCSTLNLRGKVFIKKMEGPIATLPPLRNGKINGDGTVELIKSPTSKVCKKTRKTVVQNAKGNGLIDNTLEEMITAKLKVDFIDINADILKKEDTAISNGILTDEIVKSLQNETNQNKEIQNGDLVERNGVDQILLNGEEIKVKEEIVSNGNIENTTENNLNLKCQYENLDLENDEDVKQPMKKRLKRRTAFEIFMNNTIDLSGMTVKRTRKAPSSFSPESPRKVKSNDVPPQAQQIKLPVDEPVPYKPVIQLTKKGLPFKKKGRKPRPKGPVEHYLDVIVRNKLKENVSNSNCDDNDNKGSEIDLDSNTITTKDIVEIPDKPSEEILENNPPSDSFKTKTVEQLLLPICNAKPIKNRYHDLKRKNIMKKQLSKKRKTFSKMDTDEFSSPIISVLGYRTHKLKKEMLVQFENGTSNWIDYHEKEFNVTKMKEYYEHTEQSLSIIHRLGYQTFFPSSSISSFSDQDLSSSDESDLDDVFFRPSPALGRKCDQLLSNKEALQSTNKEVEMSLDSEKGLKNLCNYALSSKCSSIYPYQNMQEMFVKNDGDFVSIYLRKLNTKDQKKGDLVNPRCCEKVISTLEDCAVDDVCKAVIINGIEEYFASSSIFEKLLKKTPALEGKKYEEDVSMLRYLIQTIRNFNKPIVAVIRKTAIGFPASLLSLFDMVFHERETEKASQTSKQSNVGRKKTLNKQPSEDVEDSEVSCPTTETECQSFVFPRLMGLTQNNESRIMGEDTRLLSPTDCTVNVDCLNEAPLSQQLRNSLRHMRSNSKIQIKRRGRSQSEISEPANDEESGDEEEEEVDDVMLPARQSNHLEQLERLEREILQEKERTEKYMSELFTYMNSLDE